MKALRYILGLLATITAIVALLIGSIEICAFGNRSFYEKQYEKNNVLEDVGMEMDDLIEVTDYMLEYLQGKHDTLSYTTTMWGEERDFFNDREREHMVDVANLNIGAVTVMYCCIFACIIFLIALALSFFTERRRDEHGFFAILCRCICIGTGAFIVILGVGAAIVSTNFDKYWRIFHTIFFSNDLWLLDPSTDMLINIVPLEFFIALVTRIVILFVIFILVMLIPSIVYLVSTRKRRRKKGGPRLPKSMLTTVLALALLLGSSHTLSLPCLADEESDEILSLDEAPDISSDAAILIERSTGTVLYSKNATKSEYPASTTKIMTALLTLENCELDETVTFSKTAIYALPTGASHIGMTPGEELSVLNCLYGLLLPSANEVANALAERVSGSMNDFVELMNKRAKELGCVNTNFVNPNGLHDDEHITCAYDLALIFMACLDTPNFISIDQTTTYVIGATNLVDETRPIKTTHKMLLSDSDYYDERVICGKTGHTDEAGGCLVTYASSDGLELVCVVLNAEQPAEYEDTETLLDYGFSSFALTSSIDLSSLGSNSSSTSYFYTSEQISPYTAKQSTAVVTLDSSLMEYSAETKEGVTSLTLTSGSLTLSTITLEAASYTDNPLEQNGLPVSYLNVMQTKVSDNTFVYILVGAAILVIIIIVLVIYNSSGRSTARRKKNTRVFKNVNLKRINVK